MQSYDRPALSPVKLSAPNARYTFSPLRDLTRLAHLVIKHLSYGRKARTNAGLSTRDHAMKFSLAFAALALLAAPSFAETMKMDATTMTCADLMKMDMIGMMDAGMAMKGAMKDDAKTTAMTDEEVSKAAEAACKMHPDGTVMDAMKM